MTRPSLACLARDEGGSTLVEFALAMALLLLSLFGLVEFGRLAHQQVATEAAGAIAARIASVRPPACAGVATAYGRGADVTLGYGTSCRVAGACTVPAAVACQGSAGNATVAEIWGRIAPLLPPGATPANLGFRYAADYGQSLGFLGGPYVPAVTVEVTGLGFRFATPLGGLAALAAGGTGGTGLPGSLALPPTSVSLPGEDLALGTAG